MMMLISFSLFDCII